MEYADDIDFISYSRPYLNDIERIAPACLAEWSLQMNAAKTERTSVSRQVDRAHEPWRTTRTLGSLLGDAEDVPCPAECNWQMSPSTKCGQFGSEGHRLAFFCDYGSTQHSSCLYLRTTWVLGYTVVTCGRSSVSAGHNIYIHVNPERSFGGTNDGPSSEARRALEGGSGGPPPEI